MKRLLFTLLSVMLVNVASAVCTPGFTWAATPSGNNLLNVTFTNASTSTFPPPQYYTTYSLNYGDASVNNGFYNTASHNYAAPGTYTVTLTMTVIDSSNQLTVCSASYPQQVVVAYSACATTVSAATTSVPQTYQFTATTPGATSAVTYAWNFGDASSGSGNPVTHTYVNPGTYTVTVTATGGGCTYTNYVVVQVFGAANCNNLNASFTHTASGSNVYFSNTSTPGANLNPPLYPNAHWTFGDGGTSVAWSPSHAYASTGTYNVCLFVNWIDSLTNTVYCSDTACQTITVTVTPPANVISGAVVWDSLNNTAQYSFKVWLIVHDSAANTLTAVDSTSVGGFFSAPYSFSGHPAGSYRTKAAQMNANTTIALCFIPTYHDSSLYWNSAHIISHSGGSTTNKNIHMMVGAPVPGPGFIGGSIALGANKGTAAGAPNVLVMLRNANNKLVNYTYTDANGLYSFSNLATGTYSIYPEEMGYTTTPELNISITAGQPTVNSIDFTKKTVSKKFVPGITGVEDLKARVFSLYPNPSKGNVYISWSNEIRGNATITVTDMAGRKVFSTNTGTANQTSLELSGLTKGFYFIRINTEKGTQTEKLSIQ